MTPAGIERDKQIAERRGDMCKIACRLDFCDNWADDRDNIPECPDYKYKPYSTDISCAMELWKELKGDLADDGELVLIASTSYIECQIFIFGEPEYAYTFSVVGETEADAISGAWLRWKEGE